MTTPATDEGADLNLSDAPTYSPTSETTAETPTGQLRFLYQQLPNGDGVRILQQQIATLSYRDGKAVAQSFRWQDVPCVMED